MDKLLKQLVKDNSKAYSKIVTFLEYKNTNRTNYDITVNGKTITVVDAEPLDGGATIKQVRLSTSNTNFSIPAVGSSGIVIFVNKYDAFVVQLADKAYIRQETTDAHGNKSVQEIKVENGKSVYAIDADDIQFNTTNGGVFQFMNDNIVIGNTARIRLQVVDDSKAVRQEVILDKDKGISIVSYSGTPIEVKNNTGSLKDILNTLIDKFNSATYVSSVGTAIVSPASQTSLNGFKINIAKLLK